MAEVEIIILNTYRKGVPRRLDSKQAATLSFQTPAFCLFQEAALIVYSLC